MRTFSPGLIKRKVLVVKNGVKNRNKFPLHIGGLVFRTRLLPGDYFFFAVYYDRSLSLNVTFTYIYIYIKDNNLVSC